MTSCKVEDILEENLTFLAPEIRSKGYEIYKEFATHVPEIQADPGLLYQAFSNILMNAMQAMSEGGSIYIEASARANVLTIIFADEGKGIPDEVLKKIWEPFFTTKEKGSGLGLPIVKKIVEGHGGTVGIGNDREKGAQVTVTLPVKGVKQT
ncbi:MAG: HAMP domain-containing histidine kinase [Proteobacteria bacterium]|nr:HAMP domain-containing histidine kinase [Pseudomonadota bacterium]